METLFLDSSLALYNDERVTLLIEPHDDNLDHEYLGACRNEILPISDPGLRA